MKKKFIIKETYDFIKKSHMAMNHTARNKILEISNKAIEIPAVENTS